MKKHTPILIILGCVLLLQCIDTTTVTNSRHGQILTSLAEHAVPTHMLDFKSKTKDLAAASATFCTTLDEADLETAREAWSTAKSPWKRIEIVKFGPAEAYPERLGSKIDHWPAKEAEIEKLVNSDAPLTEEAFDSMLSATRGLPIIEYLLWVGEPSAFEALSTNPRRCEFLAGASADIHKTAGRLHTAWIDEWLVQLTDPKSVTDGEYATTQEVVDEWVNRMTFTVDNIRIKKLGKPLGSGDDGPYVDLLESPFSNRSLEDAIDALEGVRDVWTGDVGDGTFGIKDLVFDFGIASNVDTLFDGALASLKAVPPPLRESIKKNKDAVTNAMDALYALQKAILKDVSKATGSIITFNDTDGD